MDKSYEVVFSKRAKRDLKQQIVTAAEAMGKRPRPPSTKQINFRSMDTKVKNSVKRDVIEWIQTLDDEKVLFNLYEFKEHYRQITPEEKQEYNRWLSELDYEPQLEMLRFIIASSPDRDAIWNELSPETQEHLRTDEEVETTDIKHTPERFWNWFRT